MVFNVAAYYRSGCASAHETHGVMQMSRLKRNLSNDAIQQFCHDCSRLPTLVVTGAKDRIVPPARAHALAAGLHNSFVAVLPECGHLSHEEAPGALLTLLRNFVYNSLAVV